MTVTCCSTRIMESIMTMPSSMDFPLYLATGKWYNTQLDQEMHQNPDGLFHQNSHQKWSLFNNKGIFIITEDFKYNLAYPVK